MTRRAVTRCARLAAIYSLLVALAVTLATPVIRLVSASARVTCCCPDPATCRCADHQKGSGDGNARMKSCKSTSDPLVGSVFPDLVAVAPITAVVQAPPAPPVRLPIAAPHAPPELERPRGPS